MSYIGALAQNPPLLIRPQRPNLVPTAAMNTGAIPQPSPTDADLNAPFINTPASVDARRRLALALLENGTSAAPINGGPWAAVARALQGGLGGYEMSAANEAEAAGRRESGLRLAQAFDNDQRGTGASMATLMTDPWAQMGGRRGYYPGSSATERIAQRLMNENPDMSYGDAVNRSRRGPQNDTIARERLAVQAMRDGAFDTLDAARTAYGLGPQNGSGAPAMAPPVGGAPMGTANSDDMLGHARDAISQGADRGQVIQRLKQMGIDPTGL